MTAPSAFSGHRLAAALIGAPAAKAQGKTPCLWLTVGLDGRLLRGEDKVWMESFHVGGVKGGEGEVSPRGVGSEVTHQLANGATPEYGVRYPAVQRFRRAAAGGGPDHPQRS